MLTAIYLLLHRLTKNDRFLVALTVSGRENWAMEQIGNYATLIPVVGEIQTGDHFYEALKGVGKKISESRKYQNYPYDYLVVDLPEGLVPTLQELEVLVAWQHDNQAQSTAAQLPTLNPDELQSSRYPLV